MAKMADSICVPSCDLWCELLFVRSACETSFHRTMGDKEREWLAKKARMDDDWTSVGIDLTWGFLPRSSFERSEFTQPRIGRDFSGWW